jgi:hypothetical protein
LTIKHVCQTTTITCIFFFQISEDVDLQLLLDDFFRMYKPVRIEIYLVLIKGSRAQSGSSPCSFNCSLSQQFESAILDLPSFDSSEMVPMANQTVISQQVKPIEPLSIIAQPKAIYRERYSSETSNDLHLPSRFIRAEEDHLKKFKYPTVEV